MGKNLFIAEKPSVAVEFAKALGVNVSSSRKDGYVESEDSVVTWCVGHLVTMSYPEVYDPALKRWSFETLPFLPDEFLYEVIPAVSKQFNIVKNLLLRDDVECIYVCTDSGREGEYIYRLVEQMAGVKNKVRKRVWIDSQTEEEILNGIKNAKDLSEYDNLSDSAYLRAKEDYLMGINFSRVLTLKYGQTISNYLRCDRTSISVGRVMTCVLGMVVRREREIRNFIKTPFYRVVGVFDFEGSKFEGEFRAVEGSKYFESLKLYKENGFKQREDAQNLIDELSVDNPIEAITDSVERKAEKKNPPLLFNLAELQNQCSKLFKISPDETLRIVQQLYEKKLVTYPRTDARVLSSAVAKVIEKNIKGLLSYEYAKPFAEEILSKASYKKIGSSRYTNDKQITDHYAIIPTGQGFSSLRSLKSVDVKVYEVIVRRFLSIFFEPAVYRKVSVVAKIKNEKFFSSFKVLEKEGYLSVMKYSFAKKENDEEKKDSLMVESLKKLKKSTPLVVDSLEIKEGETSPPKRYNSGSMILAMENAGQLIEDEELRAQIKGSGIGTSATRAEIIKKLVAKEYIALNNKTQILTPTQLGEMIFDVVAASVKSLLNPELTASWEKGLTYVAQGSITADEYMIKLNNFVASRTRGVVGLHNQYQLRSCFDAVAPFYNKVKK